MPDRRNGAVAVVLIAAMVLSIVVVPAGPIGGAAAAGDGTTVVAADGSGDYTTIQNAVNNSTSGDTIQIEPGNYSETEGDRDPIVVAKSDLTIRGDPGDATRGPGPDAPYIDADDGTTFELTRAATGTTITGIAGDDVLIGAELGGYGESGLTYSNVELVQSELSRVYFGITAAEGSTSAYENVEISGNVFEEPRYDNPSIEIGNVADSRQEYVYENLTISNNRIRNPVIVGNNHETDYRNITVSDNRMGPLTLEFFGDNADAPAKHGYGTDPSTVDGVTVARNDFAYVDAEDAITLRMAGAFNPRYENVSVANNTIESTGSNDVRHGIWLEVNNSQGAVYDVDVHDNVINESDNDGVVVQTAGDDGTPKVPTVSTTITGNEIRNGGDNAIQFVQSTEAEHGLAAPFEISRNVFAGNGYGITNNVTGGDVDARNNYWGAADGPASRADGSLEDPVTGVPADGSGQTVSENASDAGVSNVRFDPYLTAPPGTGEATFSITVDSTNGPVIEGDTVSVDATVTNDGNAAGTQTVTLSTDATERDSTELTLEEGDSSSVRLQWASGTGDAGTYTATVATEDDTDSTGVTVQTSDQGSPTATFTSSPETPETSDTVSLDATNSTDPDGSIDAYEWDVDDDGTYEFTGETNSTSFPKPGDYPVTLRVTDDDGTYTSTTRTVSVRSAEDDSSNDDGDDGDDSDDSDDSDDGDDGDEDDSSSSGWTGGGSPFVGGGSSPGSDSSESSDSSDSPDESDDVVEALADRAPEEPGVQVPIEASPLEELAFENESVEESGDVVVEPLDDPPTTLTDEFDPEAVVAATEIDVPEAATTEQATVRFRVFETEFDDGDLDSLQVVRVHDGEPQRLPTNASTGANGTITVEASTPGFSTFAVVTTGTERTPADETATPTPALTATPADQASQQTATTTPAESEGSGGLPIAGMLVAMLALLLAGASARSRTSGSE
jgi:PGF-pre-PGF domain-containing protein